MAAVHIASSVVLLAALAAAQQAARPAQQAPKRGGRPAAAAEQINVRDNTFHSASLGRSMKYRIILPAGYERGVRRYPVLYLLHGLTGDYGDWESRTRLTDYAQPLQLILVMPDAGDSWYTNAAAVPEDKFEDYVVKDLVAHVDKTYRSIAARHGRAIAGLSMGGYGAVKIGLKHPGNFAFVGSFSGAFGAAHNPNWFSDQPERAAEMRKIFGAAGSETHKQNDVFELAAKAEPARLPYIYLDCGTEDFLFALNREFSAVLSERKIEHEYRELPGAHNWEYWDRQIAEMLRVLAKHMEIPGKQPVSALPPAGP